MLSIYNFGNFRYGFRTYPKQQGFEKYSNSIYKDELFEIIRNADKTIFVYVKYGFQTAVSGGNSGSMFGISVVVQNNYVSNPLHIHTILQNVVSQMLKEKQLITINEYGFRCFIPQSITDRKEYLDKWSEKITTKIQTALKDYIKPIDASQHVVSSTVKLPLSSNIEAIKPYINNYACISLSPQHTSETVVAMQVKEQKTIIPEKQKEEVKGIKIIEEAKQETKQEPVITEIKTEKAEPIISEPVKEIHRAEIPKTETPKTEISKTISSTQIIQAPETTTSKKYLKPLLFILPVILILLGAYFVFNKYFNNNISEINPIVDTTTEIVTGTNNNNTIIDDAQQKGKNKFDALMKKINGNDYLGEGNKEYTKAIELLLKERENYPKYKESINNKIAELEEERINFVKKQVEKYVKLNTFSYKQKQKLLNSAKIADNTKVYKVTTSCNQYAKKWLKEHQMDSRMWRKYKPKSKNFNSFVTPAYKVKALLSNNKKPNEIAGMSVISLGVNFIYTITEINKINDMYFENIYDSKNEDTPKYSKNIFKGKLYSIIEKKGMLYITDKKGIKSDLNDDKNVDYYWYVLRENINESKIKDKRRILSVLSSYDGKQRIIESCKLSYVYPELNSIIELTLRNLEFK